MPLGPKMTPPWGLQYQYCEFVYGQAEALMTTHCSSISVRFLCVLKSGPAMCPCLSLLFAANFGLKYRKRFGSCLFLSGHLKYCDICMSIPTSDTLFHRATIATVIWEQQVDLSRRQGCMRGRYRPASSGTPKHRIANVIWGPGTNYSNIYHESKTERSSEAVIWAMDASDWMILLK